MGRGIFGIDFVQLLFVSKAKIKFAKGLTSDYMSELQPHYFGTIEKTFLYSKWENLLVKYVLLNIERME